MKSSPISNLLECEITPAKVIVGTDINGWLETQEKKASPIKYKSRIPKPNKPITPLPRSSLAELRQEKINVLKSTIKKYEDKTENRTAASSGRRSSASNNRFNSEGFFIRSLSKSKKNQQKNEIKISEFTTEDNQPLLKINGRKDQQHAKKGAKLLKLSDMLFPSKPEGLNKLLLRCGAEVIQDKITNHQYRSLSFVNRKQINSRQQ